MWNFLNGVLIQFRSCFRRNASFKWFVIIVIGLMIRSDKLGVTSIVRDLSLAEGAYIPMLNFFRANSWNLETLIIKWCLIVKEHAPICREDGMIVLIGDGVKQPKEGKKMPGVKKLHQESENSSKAEYIFGNMFGGVGVLIGNTYKMFCVPLSLRIHDGIKTIKRWCNDLPEEVEDSHVVQMISNAFSIAKTMGESSLLLLDRYFLCATLITVQKLS
jgi:DDE superfamily endonuclease